MYRVIAGGTGLIGSCLVKHWLKQGHRITVIGRSEARIEKVFGTHVKAISWDKLTSRDLESADVLVNLTGANIGAKRWTAAYKKEVIASRTESTKTLVNLLSELTQTIPAFFNASAVGIYGPQTPLTEGLPARLDETATVPCEQPPSFLSQVGCQWEKAAEPAVKQGVRVVFLRFGVVLAKQGGVLPQLMKSFQWYLGGPLGTGNQPFSWVAMPDVIRAIDFLISQASVSGAFNIVAPGCVQQKTFARLLGKVMNRPDIVNLPAFLLKFIFGQEMARELMLEGQRIYPQRLLDLGFSFTYPQLESALNYLIKKSS